MATHFGLQGFYDTVIHEGAHAIGVGLNEWDHYQAEALAETCNSDDDQ